MSACRETETQREAEFSVWSHLYGEEEWTHAKHSENQVRFWDQYKHYQDWMSYCISSPELEQT